jgi:hypothetical protein
VKVIKRNSSHSPMMLSDGRPSGSGNLMDYQWCLQFNDVLSFGCKFSLGTAACSA